jgi:hypothetical protein
LVSQITAKLESQFESINDTRRFNVAAHRDMVRRKDINLQRKEINKTIERSVEVARTTVRGMLGAYRDGVSQSIGMRRTIVNEVEVAQRSNAQKKLGQVDTEGFLPQIEKWE